MAQSSGENSIPRFGLYGENRVETDPGFVHIEDISARSKANNWVIKPHRHAGLFQVLFLFGGRAEVQMDAQHVQLEGCWAITLSPGVVHGFHFPPDARGAVLTLAEPILKSAESRGGDAPFEQLMAGPMQIEFKPGDAPWTRLCGYLQLIQMELQNLESDKGRVLEWLAKIVLTLLTRQLRQQQLQATVGTASLEKLNCFRNLLDQHYSHHWSVRQYASAMNISTSSLNRLCNDTQGTPAKIIIQERLLVEAKRLLIYTRMTLEQVAYTLGFKDPAYFSRFFKTRTSTSPSGFRDANNYGTQAVR